MKRLLTLVVVLFMCCGTSFVLAGEDRPINPEQLPQTIKVFLDQYFPGEKIALAKMEKELFGTEYKVYLVGGSKIEFGKDKEWKEVDCEFSEVPSALIPQKIKEFVNTNYPDQKVIQIEKKNKRKVKYEVELSNSIEIEFDGHYNVVDID